jgi:hypothetical protein
MNPFARSDVKNLDRFVILCKQKQTVAFDVWRKMFEVAHISRQECRMHQPKGRISLSMSAHRYKK